MKKQAIFFTMALVVCSNLMATDSKSDFKKGVLATVDGVEITETMRDQLIKNVLKNATPEMIEKAGGMQKVTEKLNTEILEQLIHKTLITNAAKKSDIGKDPKVQELIAQTIESIKESIISEYFIKKQLNSKLTNLDAEVEKKYKEIRNALKNKHEIKFRKILVAKEADAKKIIARLKKGDDFQKLARENSIDDCAKHGGGDAYVIEDALGALKDHVIRLKPGSYTSEPIKSDEGFYVLKVDARRPATAPKLDDIKERLVAVVQQSAAKELLKRLRDSQTIHQRTDEVITSK